MGRNSRMIERIYSSALPNRSISGTRSDFMLPMRLSIIINVLC
jgi:hypothetical protein